MSNDPSRSSSPSSSTLLDKIRNMWEFAATIQFLYLFYDMYNLNDFDIEVSSQKFILHRYSKKNLLVQEIQI